MSESSANNFGEQVETAKARFAEGDTIMANAAEQNQETLNVVIGIARSIQELQNTITALSSGDTAAVPALQATISDAYDHYGQGENILITGLEGSANPHASNAKGMAGGLTALVGGPLSEISIATYLRTADSELDAAVHGLRYALIHVDKATVALYNASRTGQIAACPAGESMSRVVAEELTAYQQDIGYTGQ